MISEDDKHQDPYSQQIALKKPEGTQWGTCYTDRRVLKQKVGPAFL